MYEQNGPTGGNTGLRENPGLAALADTNYIRNDNDEAEGKDDYNKPLQTNTKREYLNE